MKHLDAFDKIMDKGVGLGCIHYGVEVPKGKSGDLFKKWIGGYFETNWSVNPHWVANMEVHDSHPVANGVEDFSLNDEWYFHMRFRDDMKGVTPIFSAVAPDSTMKRRAKASASPAATSTKTGPTMTSAKRCSTASSGSPTARCRKAA